MVFLPFKLHQQQFLTMNGDSLEAMLSDLPPTILTLASNDFELDTEPESGTAADSAEILDTLEDARDLCGFFQQKV